MKCFHDKNLNDCDTCKIIKKIHQQQHVKFGNLYKLSEEIHKQLEGNNKNNNKPPLKINRMKNILVPITPLQKRIASEILKNPKNTRGYPFMLNQLTNSFEKLKK
uniref:Uncharacterized protein n=1 Tax=viral metagenome TaxID=1070528 RepID=A0A6C0JYQ0_9ZZZZ